MELASLVSFSSRPHPFAVQAEPCRDLSCSCRDVFLTLTEVNLQGAALPDPLVFPLRVDLQSFVEREPPQRSSEVEALAREFLVQFPPARIEELVEHWHEQRAIQQRLATFTATGSPDELLGYSEVIRPGEVLRQSGQSCSVFFAHQGREFLIEDYYCANPQCDCQEVHVEFWERIEQFHPKHRVEVDRCLFARVALDGRLNEIRFRRDGQPAAQQLLKAWQAECGQQLQEFRKRYQQMKAIGERSFPAPREPQRIELPGHLPLKTTELSPSRRTGRNAPCPCGSGLKYKRCCAPRVKSSE